ncbi:MAG: recombinase family protein [Defluviitaleaceae bacterium]|nr:recombinase family protein [Defluviitaleaceae bacterium]
MKTAVIYARYSTDMQTEQSIEGQIHVCKEYAKKNNLTIIENYIDRAVSGKTENRPQFLRMVDDSKNGCFNAVLVYKVDRFSRNKYDSVYYKKKLRDNGVRVVSATEGISDTPEGVLLESLLEGMAEFYSRELAQKTLRGLHQSALKCKFTGGHVTLGYKISANKDYEIDEVNAAIVRFIFESYATGVSYGNIIKELNKRGHKSAAGRNFGNNSLNSILSNKKYIGVYEFMDDVFIEDGIPAIIDKELFKVVQNKMALNKKRSGRAKAKINYLLSGKLYCGLCGGSMVGQSTTNTKGYTTAYYECNVKKRVKTCKKKNVRKDWIEGLVVSETMAMLTDELIDYIAGRVYEVCERDRNNEGIINGLTANLKEVETRLKNISKAIAQGIITDTTKNMLLEAEEDKIYYEGQIEKEKFINKTVLTKEQIAYWISQFKNGDPADEEFRRRLIEALINSVYVFDDKIVITYNYSGDSNKLTLENINSSLNAFKNGKNGGSKGASSGVKLSDIAGFAPAKLCKANKCVFVWGMASAVPHFISHRKGE